jgi:hypothetical protein
MRDLQSIMIENDLQVIKYLINEALKNGGVTFNTDLIKVDFKKGYQVGLNDFNLSLENATPQAVLKFINFLKIVKNISNDNNFYIGLWVDDDRLYIDKSVYLESKKEAIKTAKTFYQKAYFDWSSLKSIKIRY